MTDLMQTHTIPHIRSHSRDSSLREKALEHLFLGGLLGRLWCQGVTDLEILKPEVDRNGYDLVLESNGVLRHVQLKARFRGSSTAEVAVHTSLLAKPGGCVIWIEFDPASMAIEKFYWFGGKAGRSLPVLGDRIAKHSKGDRLGRKSQRPNLRVITKGRFTALLTMDEVIATLFGQRLSS